MEKSIEEACGIISNSYYTDIISATLDIYSLNYSPVYAYDISTTYNGGTRFFVDAQHEDIIETLSTTTNETIPTESYRTEQIDYYDNSVEVYLERTLTDGTDVYTYYLADCLRNIYIMDNRNYDDLSGNVYKNNTGIFDDKVAISAFNNLVASFDFYTDPSNIGVSLRGVDGSVNLIHDDADATNEMIVYAYMHYGSSYENAAYMSGLKEEYPNEAVFIFGDGNPDRLFDFAVSLDVVGHEYQHAITSYSADLIYLNAAGAMNEAFSDIFGALIQGYELDDERFWLIGEDITNPSYQKALRDMQDPNSLDYPDTYKGTYSYPFCYQNHNHSGCDNGGVHYNSSIITHAAYQMYNLQPSLFTKEIMGELWYSTLLLLQQDSEFEDLRVLMTQAATMLGYNQTIIDTIGLAFDHVNVFGTDGIHTITFNKGDMVDETPAPISLQYGETFTISEANLTKDGYSLIGWSITGNANSKIYYVGQEYDMPAYDLTLYPIYATEMWNDLKPTTLEGIGTPSTPYLVKSAADLATLAYYTNNRNVISGALYNDDTFML